MNIDALRALIERRRSIRGYKTRALQGAYGRKGGPAKYWVSDKPTAFVFRNGMGRHVSGRFISAIAEQ